MAPDDQDARAAYAAIQNCYPGPTISGCAFGCMQPVQFRLPSGQGQPLPGPETPFLCVLGSGNGKLIELGIRLPRLAKVNLTVP